jgi:mannose-6-phosphate isomerase
MTDERKTAVLSELLRTAKRLEASRPEYRWIIRINELYPDDIGTLYVILLNLVKLERGQAMFCAAGDLHAYLEGFGVELMANSDNVLRGGLTPKHVDIPDLARTLTFKDRPVGVIEPRDGRYSTPAEEFELSVLELSGVDVERLSPGFEILVNVSGDAAVSAHPNGEVVSLPQGASVAIPACVTDYVLRGNGTLFSASAPESGDGPAMER